MIVRTLFCVALAVFALVYYYGLGPPPTPSELMNLPWWRPRGFLARWALRTELGPSTGEGPPWGLVSLFALLPLFVALIGLRVFRHPLPRMLQLGLCLALSALALSGLVFPIGWSFFEWRFPAVVIVTAGFVGAAMFAPSLLQLALRQPPIPRTLWLVGAVLVIYVASTEITGWEPALQANLSPWPVVTLFGFLLFGYVIASLHVAAGVGEAVASALTGRTGRLAGLALAGISGAAMSAGLVSSPTIVFAVAMTFVSAAYAFMATRPAGSSVPGLLRVSAGAVLALSIFLSNWAGVRSYDLARNHTAPIVLAALESYHGTHGEYPESLDQLVPDELDELPRPRIGWIPHDDERFTYLNFGDSYALEFPSILWIQCSYSPPYVDPYMDDEEEDEEAYAEESEAIDVAAGKSAEADEADPLSSLAGSWSCDSAPPQLW